MLSSSKSSSDSSTAVMEMTEVTPMLHTIAEEGILWFLLKLK